MQFLNLVHKYEREIDLIKRDLEKRPHNWPKYQMQVDNSLDEVFSLCASFERENLKDEQRLYKMKRIFQDNFGEYFKIGKYTKWVCEKPLGYAGDYQIIEWIYQNRPDTEGVMRCSDNYFLKTGASVATRNRKADFKRLIQDNLLESCNGTIQIMDLACGPCRDIFELYNERSSNVFHVTCVDHDPRAIEHARKLIQKLNQRDCVEFVQKNVVKIALAKDVHALFPHEYDIIFSTGLFDYLNHKLSVRLVQNLRELLKQDGLLIISNYRDKFSNPSRLYMEWGGNWELIYRTEDEFMRVFIEAGFRPTDLRLQFEEQKIMQYCLATK